MRLNRWHRLTAVLAIAMMAFGGSMVAAGAAGAAGGGQTSAARPYLIFNNDKQQAQLTIPTPPCPPKKNKHCKWKLYMNLPTMPQTPTVGYVIGKTGTLTIPYPKYCGQIQADALIGPSPWVYKIGIRTQIMTCHETTTTTTTTTTTRPPATTTTSSTVPPIVAASSTTPTTATPTSALPFTDPTTATTASAQTAAAELPFTGFDIKPLVLFGVLLMVLGGFLLSTVESRRRMLRRATAVNLEHVKDGMRNTSSWFLGE